MNNIKEKAVGFYIHVDDVKYELVEGMLNTWEVYINSKLIVENCSYRRAIQIIINRIGVGDIY